MTQLSRRSGIAVLVRSLAAAMILGSAASAQTAGGLWVGPIDSFLITAPDREFGHISLLLNTSIGPRLLAWYYEGGGASATTKAYLFHGTNLVPIFEVAQSLPSNVFCSAHTFRADGSLVVSGGLVPPPSGSCCFAIGSTTCSNNHVYVFDPISLAWSAPSLQGMAHSRFYASQVPVTSPGVVEVPGDPLVIGGTADEACDTATGPPLPGPLAQFDGKYVGGYEVYRQSTGTWSLQGPAAGYVEADPAYPFWPSYPSYLPPYFRWYPRTHLFAKYDPLDPLEPEIVFVAGDTAITRVYAWPFYAGAAAEPKRQTENYLKGSHKIDVVNSLVTTVGQHFLAPPVPPGPADCSTLLPLNGYYASSVLMHTRTGPGGSLVRNRVLQFGGSHGRWSNTAAEPGSVAIRQVMEWNDAVGIWVPKAPLAEARVFQNAVLLPDGKILIVGGYTNDNQNWEVFSAPAPTLAQSYEIYDPAAGPGHCGTTNWGLIPPTLDRPRGYHAIAILMPNGTVLVGGGEEPFGSESPRSRDSCEIFFPNYCLGPRPAIGFPTPNLEPNVTIPAATGYGAYLGSPASPPFVLPVSGVTGDPSTFRVALMRPGSVTHHFDFEQRYVDLQILSATQSNVDDGNWTLTIAPPDDPTLAPPGYYMLFFVDDGIPSASVTVHVP
jgi:Domain of unknown function (DUF1929)